jgi:hypothetical protein
METVNDSHEPANEERQIVAELKRGILGTYFNSSS